MSQPSVEELRDQLRALGYLSHGIDRWFALDPWSSRTFWAELFAITAKASLIASPFAALPLTAVMLLRNRPPLYDALLLLLVYVVSSLGGVALVILASAALLKLRPIAVIERPGALLWISLLESAVVVAAILAWWLAFPAAPFLIEVAVTIALLLLFLAIGTLAFSAALLSFSIYETRQIPSMHSRSRTVPLMVAGATLLALLMFFVPGVRPGIAAADPLQVVVTPTQGRVALIGVDGLSHEIFGARSDSTRLLPHLVRLSDRPKGSAPEVWSSIATGTPAELHGVRSIEAVRFVGSERVLQAVSALDFVLTDLAETLRLTRQQPLPPTVRERHYVWEILGSRGVRSLAINWWATVNQHEPALRSVSQESIYATAARTPKSSPLQLALGIDRVSLELLDQSIGDRSLQFVSIYLPALDIVLNRIELASAARLAASVRSLDGLSESLSRLKSDNWTILLVGLPAAEQEGTGFIASTMPLSAQASTTSVAPTVLDLFGFPASREMGGRSLLAQSQQARIRTYGQRRLERETRVDEDYYEKLRSLGYVR